MKEFVEFYQGLPLAESLLIKDSDFHWSKLFAWDRGKDFRIATPVHAVSHQGGKWIQEFTKTYGPAVVMPLSLLNKGLGFGARAIKEKKFSAKLSHVPGFYSAASCFNKPFVYGTPIMVVEGVLDAEVASLAYPWVLATLTSKISEAQAFLLSTLTGTVILSFDNDEAGAKGTRFSTPHLTKWGIKYVDMRPGGVKDWGDLLSCPREKMQDELNRLVMNMHARGVL